MREAKRSASFEVMAKAEAAVRTTTAEALLGVLSLGAMTGYEIRRTVEASIGNFWSESFGQIYPALKRLVKDGLAEKVPEVHGGRGTVRKAYRLTASGRKRLDAWLQTASVERVPRNEMLLKLFFAGRLGPAAARAQVAAYQEILASRLAHYEGVRELFSTQYARFPDAPYWRMTLDYGVAETEALQGWCKATLRQLEQMEEAQDAS